MREGTPRPGRQDRDASPTARLLLWSPGSLAEGPAAPDGPGPASGARKSAKCRRASRWHQLPGRPPRSHRCCPFGMATLAIATEDEADVREGARGAGPLGELREGGRRGQGPGVPGEERGMCAPSAGARARSPDRDGGVRYSEPNVILRARSPVVPKIIEAPAACGAVPLTYGAPPGPRSPLFRARGGSPRRRPRKELGGQVIGLVPGLPRRRPGGRPPGLPRQTRAAQARWRARSVNVKQSCRAPGSLASLKPGRCPRLRHRRELALLAG